MVKAALVEKVLKMNGYIKVSTKPHGVLYINSGHKRSTTVGQHYRKGDIPPGTLRAIERQTGLKF